MFTIHWVIASCIGTLVLFAFIWREVQNDKKLRVKELRLQLVLKAVVEVCGKEIYEQVADKATFKFFAQNATETTDLWLPIAKDRNRLVYELDDLVSDLLVARGHTVKIDWMVRELTDIIEGPRKRVKVTIISEKPLTG